MHIFVMLIVMYIFTMPVSKIPKTPALKASKAFNNWSETQCILVCIDVQVIVRLGS